MSKPDILALYTKIETLENKVNNALNELSVTQIQHGSATVTPSAANTPTGKTVKFSKSFSGTPDVVASASSSAPGTTVLGVSTNGATTTEFTMWVTRTNTNNVVTRWIAVY